MSNRVFSLSDYPGLAPKITRTPYYDTRIQEAVSGKEMRSSWWGSPRYSLKLSFEVLRDTASNPELKSLLGFYHAHAGALDSFLIDDGASVEGMLFGVGDGTTYAYQLQSSDVPADSWGEEYDGTGPRFWPELGDGFLPIWEPNEIEIFDDGIEVEQVADEGDLDVGTCFIGTPGVIEFGYAPVAESPLTWTGTYYTRARFEEPFTVEQIVPGLWSATISLKSVKP